MRSVLAKIKQLSRQIKPKTKVKFIYDESEIDAGAQGVIWVLYNSGTKPTNNS